MKNGKIIVDFIHRHYQTDAFIPLHEPVFQGNEKKYVTDCIDSTFVSSVGEYVTRFERMLADFVGAKHAVATVNGTAALHTALIVSGLESGDEVITQPLTFIATLNAISYCGGKPVFVDVERKTMGLSPEKLEAFLEENAEIRSCGDCFNKNTGRRIKACVPMHTFGHPCRIESIKTVCERFHITLIEDSAESIGSLYHGKHTGTFGAMGVFSFNGNKTITTGGGGMVITDDDVLAKRLKHITTTAKVPHPYEYIHDEIGYNYRLPNLNAALGCAQMEKLDDYIANKRQTAAKFQTFFKELGVEFMVEPEGAFSNYWLNALIFQDKRDRDLFLEFSNANGVMSRPVWKLMHTLPMFQDAQKGNLDTAIWLEERVVNIPSGVVL